MTTPHSHGTATRRVLIVHYHFLPVHNVAVKQLLSYARRLRGYGWQPTILTRDWRGIEDQDPSWGLSWEPQLAADLDFEIHAVPAPQPPRGWQKVARLPWPLRPFATLARLLFGDYPDEFVRWIAPAVRAALRLARETPFDAVLTYCPPETNHIIGARLARRWRVPWVPFFGDLWGFFIAELPASPRGLIRKWFHRHWMHPAAACVAVSPYMARYLTQTYGKRTELVLAGFDPREFDASIRAGEARLVVSHVGSLYPQDQKPSLFFDGLDVLLREHPEVKPRLIVQFVGSKCDAYLRDLIAGRSCSEICVVLPKVDSVTALSMVSNSDVLLAFNCTVHRSRHGTMSYPTKIFEAFGAGRPVLAMPPDGDWVDELLKRTQAGVGAATADEVAAVLWQWFVAWRCDGRIPYAPSSDAIAALTVDGQAARLASLLDSLIPAASTRNSP